MSKDRSLPTPPDDKKNPAAQARYLSQIVRYYFGLSLSEKTVHGLRRYLGSAGPENVEDLTSALLLECLEARKAGIKLTEQDIIRAADKLRQRLLRASKRTVLTNQPELTPSEELPPEDEIMLILREFQTVLERSFPEEALLFQRYYLDGKRDVKALAEELGMSVSTIYRHLNQIRQRFLSRREALEPPHWAD